MKLKHGPLTSNNFQHDPKNPNSNNSKPNTMKPTFALASQAEPLFAEMLSKSHVHPSFLLFRAKTALTSLTPTLANESLKVQQPCHSVTHLNSAASR